MIELKKSLDGALSDGLLSAAAHRNLTLQLDSAQLENWERDSIAQLADAREWNELNDRFYTTLRFGTGGLRGRTIGRVVTGAETGESLGDQPARPAAGTNMMNYANVERATRALMRYAWKHFGEAPRLAIAYDTRFFSPEFGNIAAKAAVDEGATVYVFPKPSPTPELSFTVRELQCHLGVVITASHNPFHDNGYKVYFADGGQIVEPQASAILAEMQSNDDPVPRSPGRVVTLDAASSDRYELALKRLVLNPDLIAAESGSLKIVYTPIHGTGAKFIPHILRSFGCEVILVTEQLEANGRFPTVTSPNPENAEALSAGMEKARAARADALLATDPDCDRIASMVPGPGGEFVRLTGNQLGAILASYRIDQLVQQGIVNDANRSHAAIIKTFVTSDLLASIASANGIKCVDTLTGFKYIGKKLHDYEAAAGGKLSTYDHQTWRKKLLEDSTYCVFACEESYGYLASDDARDKDANAAAVMFLETLSYVKSTGRSMVEYLDEIYMRYGYFCERMETATFEGQRGAQQIKHVLASYESDPPKVWGGHAVRQVLDYSKGPHFDVDGEVIPKELMLFFELESGYKVAVRGSGTEPKVKYYFFARRDVDSPESLGAAKEAEAAELERLWAFTNQDIARRLESL